MPITVSDLKFRLSERMTDNDDGGGRMSAVEIAPGSSNGVFDDIDDVSRAAGGVSLRKVYAHVASDTDDKYLGSGIVIFKPPADPDVSVLAFSTGDFYDERADLQDRLESQISRGARLQAYLWGNHGIGQRSVTLWGRTSAKIPGVGERLDLVEYDSGTEEHNQVVWPTRITVTEMTFYDGEGAYQVNQIVIEIAEGLRYAFTGTEPSREDTGNLPSKVFETRYNAGTVPIQGIRPLVQAAAPAERSVKIDSLYTPLIPTSFAETAIPDAVPGGGAGALVQANAASISRAFSGISIGNNQTLYLGSPIYPGSLTLTVSGSALTDRGGALRFGGSDVGTVDYSNGVLRFNELSPTGTSATAVFIPAAMPTRVTETAQQFVTAGNRGFVWVITLRPLPSPASMQVAYRVNNEWYSLFDNGAGVLSGVDSSYGTGSINYGTGTVTITTGALPDVDSSILYSWTTPMQTFARGGESVAPLIIRGTAENVPVLPGTVSITWGAGASGVEDAAGDGELATQSGLTGGTGRIRYDTGEWWLQPDTLPLMGAEFSLTYDYGDDSALVEDTWAAPALDVDGNLSLTLSEAPKPGTLKLEVGVELDEWVTETGEDVVDIPPLAPPPPPPPPPPGTHYFAYLVAMITPCSDTYGPTRCVLHLKTVTSYASVDDATAAAETLSGATSATGYITANGNSVTAAGIVCTVINPVKAAITGTGPHVISGGRGTVSKPYIHNGFGAG